MQGKSVTLGLGDLTSLRMFLTQGDKQQKTCGVFLEVYTWNLEGFNVLNGVRYMYDAIPLNRNLA